MKHLKTEIKIGTKTWFYRQATAKSSILALKCGENTKHYKFKISVFRGFTVHVSTVDSLHMRVTLDVPKVCGSLYTALKLCVGHLTCSLSCMGHFAHPRNCHIHAMKFYVHCMSLYTFSMLYVGHLTRLLTCVGHFIRPRVWMDHFIYPECVVTLLITEVV